MTLGNRIRRFREAKNLSQGDIERRTGLLRCYISRVENGHTVPSIETLERLAASLEIPLYRLFYEGDDVSDVALASRPSTAGIPPITVLNRIRRIREKNSGASDDARLAFRTLAKVFSNL